MTRKEGSPQDRRDIFDLVEGFAMPLDEWKARQRDIHNAVFSGKEGTALADFSHGLRIGGLRRIKQAIGVLSEQLDVSFRGNDPLAIASPVSPRSKRR